MYNKKGKLSDKISAFQLQQLLLANWETSKQICKTSKGMLRTSTPNSWLKQQLTGHYLLLKSSAKSSFVKKYD